MGVRGQHTDTREHDNQDVVAGTDPFSVLLQRDRPRFEKAARSALQRLRVGEAMISAECVIQEAWIRVSRRAPIGSTAPAASEADPAKRLLRTIHRVAIDVSRRQRSRKRGAHRTDLDISMVVDDRLGRSDALTVAADQASWLLSRLGAGKQGEFLRRLVQLRVEGYSNEEIALQLGWKDVRSVERRFQQIRARLQPYLNEDQ